jgi:ribosome assembly protein 1
MASPKTKDAPRGTIHGSSTNSLVNYTIRAVPLPLPITSFLQANTATMRRIQPDRRNKHAEKENDVDETDQVASKQLTSEMGGEESGSREVKPEEFWEALKAVCEGCGREWKGMEERIWAFGPKRVGANLLLDRPEGRVKSSVITSFS